MKKKPEKFILPFLHGVQKILESFHGEIQTIHIELLLLKSCYTEQRRNRLKESIYKTPLDELMGDISSLGLSWRGRLMHEMARYIVEECDSRIPSSKEGLLKLPGVGPYIASALMCFVYKKPEPVLDTNTVRVIGRLHGIRISDSSRRSKKFESIMRSYLKYGCPRDFSLSLIDLAALVCTSSESPHCEMCPVGEWCCRCREMEGGGIT
jgi:A/G-specific adenine glycosylase